MEEDHPKVIYKYRYFDDEGHTLDMIKDGEIWLSSARNFNDPFDTAITHNFDELYKPIAEEWARSVVKREKPDLTNEEIKIYASKKLTEIRNNPDEYFKKAKERIIEIQYNKFGICSFSESDNNILLWSHYTKNHAGVCIGFNTEVIFNYANQIAEKEQELLDLVKVKYSNEYPKYSLFKSKLKEELSDIFNLLYTKSSDWSYEKEYRLIYWGKTNFGIELGSKAISEVILGCCITREHRENILNICTSLDDSPSVYQAVKSDSSFSIELKNIL
ncbi:DUF2971 domain-containing protein [Halanaerobium congolense]|jgi:hypothetical protein|uniref:DUF2971 domain-containing protein n=1 Tax=Halanaerobium congolense TaxID=54121 RepID=UPI00106073AF|nr:DUF2971 domain-containing protein [Halanaerobium congolense]TDP26846.1 hypothetical protein C8C79_10243 [Halanaerobium congolense]